jgi:hypothetical protein
MKKTHEREKCVCHVVLRETFAMKNSLHLAFFLKKTLRGIVTLFQREEKSWILTTQK